MTNYAVQEQNQDLVSLLAAHFRLLYNPTHAMADTSASYKNLPGLIGFWTGAKGTTTNGSHLRDVSSSGLHLTPGGNGPERAESTSLRRWGVFNGSTIYYSIADSVYTSILGTETDIHSTIRGLTAMAWVRPDTAPGSIETAIAKFGAAGNRSWRLYRVATGTMQFIISNDGTATFTVNTPNIIAQNEWRFVAARFTPSSEIRIWEGSVSGLATNVNTTSIPASLFDSSDNLAIGARSITTTPTEFWSGDLSLVALCRAALPSAFINVIFNMTAPLFLDNLQ